MQATHQVAIVVYILNRAVGASSSGAGSLRFSSTKRSPRDPILVAQPAADSLLLFEKPHGAVQIAAGEDRRLVAEARLQPVLVAQLAADLLLLFVQPHGPVQVAAGLEDTCLVAEAS